MMIDISWTCNASRSDLIFILQEYRFFVRRFPEWIENTIGKSRREILINKLMPNLNEERGCQGREPHLNLLDGMLYSCGVEISKSYSAIKSTVLLEEEIFDFFKTKDLYSCLCVLGPGTECVSWQFLEPLEACAKKHFPFLDNRYFQVHKNEEEHIRAINESLHILEIEDPSTLLFKNSMIDTGVLFHKRFWKGLEIQIFHKGLA